MGLADLIIENQKYNGGTDARDLHEYCDELGICTLVKDPNNPVEIKNDPKYYSIRIRTINFRKYKEHKQGLIHKRDGVLYIGNDILRRNDNNLFRLVKSRTPIPQHIKAQIWDDLYDNVPTFSNEKIIVSDELVYDKVSGTLEEQDGDLLSTGLGGETGWQE